MGQRAQSPAAVSAVTPCRLTMEFAFMNPFRAFFNMIEEGIVSAIDRAFARRGVIIDEDSVSLSIPPAVDAEPLALTHEAEAPAETNGRARTNGRATRAAAR